MKNSRICITFNLSEEVKRQLDEAIPKSKRSQFVEKAIADAIMTQARQKALQTISTMPAYAKNGDDSVAVLKRIRNERQQQLVTRRQS